MSAIDIIRDPALEPFAHGFLGRRGGVSTGLYASLNMGLGSRDDPADVAENRRRGGAAIMAGATLVTVHQVHSATCVNVTTAFPGDDARPAADAMVTRTPGLLLGVLTADCVPVLFADATAGIVGAAHAGWGGAFRGVVEATVAAMVALGAAPARIAAVTGPCIQQASYEVGDDYRARFVTDDASNATLFAPGRPGHWQFDLEDYVGRRLTRAGVGRIIRRRIDTCADAVRYFSYRRATQRGEADYGRQIALIGVPE